jgi:hypothetical protein
MSAGEGRHFWEAATGADAGWDLHPTGERRLFTAHTRGGRCGVVVRGVSGGLSGDRGGTPAHQR